MLAAVTPPGVNLRLVSETAEDLWPKVLEDFAAGRLQSIYRMHGRPLIGSRPAPRYDLMDNSRLGVWRPVPATPTGFRR